MNSSPPSIDRTPGLRLADMASMNRDEPETGSFPKPALLFGALAAYFCLQVVLRILVSPSVERDEAEQLLLGQRFSWGYGSQPPLYTWIQMGFFALLGTSVLALALFKNLLLFGLYGLTYATTRRMTRSHGCAAAATLSLLYIPQVAWESQRDLTHSILASTMAIAILYCFVRLLQEDRLRWFLLFGLACGAGVLSKYNVVLWIGGLMLACLTIPNFRSAVLNRRMAMAFGLAALVVLPNLLWAVEHRDASLLGTRKFHIEASMPWLTAAWAGSLNLIYSVACFLGPMAIVYGTMLFRPGFATEECRVGQEYGKFLVRTFLLILPALVVLIAVYRITIFRGRWLQPMLVATPIAAVVAIASLRQRLDPLGLKFMAAVSGLVMVIVAVVLPVRVFLAERLGRDEPLNLPYRDVAARLDSMLDGSTVILAEHSVLAGNLRLALPGRTVATPELAALIPRQGSSKYLVVWDATRRDLPRGPIQQWIASTTLDFKELEPQYFSAPYRYFSGRQMRLGAAVVK